MVLDQLDDRVDGLVAEVALAAPGQGVGLVDEQHAADGLLEDRLDLERGLADEAGHQPGPVGLHQVPLLDHLQGPVDLGQQAGDRRLAGPRVAGEDQVATGLDHRQAPRQPQLLHPEQVGDELDLGLHRRQADQPVELGQQLLDRSGRAEGLSRGTAGARRAEAGVAGPPAGWGWGPPGRRSPAASIACSSAERKRSTADSSAWDGNASRARTVWPTPRAAVIRPGPVAVVAAVGVHQESEQRRRGVEERAAAGEQARGPHGVRGWPPGPRCRTGGRTRR